MMKNSTTTPTTRAATTTSPEAADTNSRFGDAAQVLADAGFSFMIVDHCPLVACEVCSGAASPRAA